MAEEPKDMRNAELDALLEAEEAFERELNGGAERYARHLWHDLYCSPNENSWRVVAQLGDPTDFDSAVIYELAQQILFAGIVVSAEREEVA